MAITAGFRRVERHTPWYNTTIGRPCVGRFLMIIPIMALAGSLGRKQICPSKRRNFPGSRFYLRGIALGTVLLVGALNFLPGLTLGPSSSIFVTGKENLY